MATPSLRDLQRDVWRALATQPGTLRASARLLAVTTPSATLAAAPRLAIYADAYFWRLHSVLVEDFPRTAAVLGPHAFQAVARDYLRAHPSADPSLRHLGDALPAFLARRLPDKPHLADLARLERARVDAFDAPDDASLSADTLRAVAPCDWPGLRFIPIRAFRLLHLEWDVLPLWGDADARPEPAGTGVRVWRDAAYRVFHAALDARAARMLGELAAGASFAVACQAFDDLPEDDASRLATGLLARWLADGLFARLG